MKYTHPHVCPRRAFTMIELLAVVATIGVLVGLLLPSVQSARECARRSSCQNNLTQIGLGVQTYHASFRQFPTQLSGTDGTAAAGFDNDRELSIFVALLPFMNQQSLANSIGRPQVPDSNLGMGFDMDMGFGIDADGEIWDEDLGEWVVPENGGAADSDPEAIVEYPRGGPEPFVSDYVPWNTEVATYRCPSDPGMGLPAYGRTNYAACMGDGIAAINTGPMKSVQGVFVIDPMLQKQTEASMRGVFVPRAVTRQRDIVDGRANTILLSEIATDLGDRDTSTAAAIGPGEKILSDNPNYGYENELVDKERPKFWLTGTKTLGATTNSQARGYRWASGMPLYTGVNTILPPNSMIIISTASDDSSGLFPASSRHQGGAHVCLADGATRFVNESIDSGDRNMPTVYIGSASPIGSQSNYGVWGALGTRNSAELVSMSQEL